MLRFFLTTLQAVTPGAAFGIASFGQIMPIPVPGNQDRKLKLLQPAVIYENRCQNTPAVDATGILSVGAAPIDACKGKSDQAYVRLFRVRTAEITMKAYVYTFFTALPAYGQTTLHSWGHWDTVVVFMDGSWIGSIRGVAYKQYGYWMSGFVPKDHNLYFSFRPEGFKQMDAFPMGGHKTDLISYSWIPQAAKTRLEQYGWGTDMQNSCPINEANLAETVFGAARSTGLWSGLTADMLKNYDTLERPHSG